MPIIGVMVNGQFGKTCVCMYNVFPNVSHVLEIKFPPTYLIFGVVKDAGNIFHHTNLEVPKIRYVGGHFM